MSFIECFTFSYVVPTAPSRCINPPIQLKSQFKQELSKTKILKLSTIGECYIWLSGKLLSIKVDPHFIVFLIRRLNLDQSVLFEGSRIIVRCSSGLPDFVL